MTKKQIKRAILALLGMQLAYSGHTKKFHITNKVWSLKKKWLSYMLAKRWCNDNLTINSLSMLIGKYYLVKSHFKKRYSFVTPTIENNLSELRAKVMDLNVRVHAKSHNEMLDLTIQSCNEWDSMIVNRINKLATFKEERAMKARHAKDWANMEARHLADRIELRKARQALSDEKRRIKNAYKTASTIERRGGGRRRRKQ